MKISGIIWLRATIDKLETKHRVSTGEVEEVFARKLHIRLIERGDIQGEDLYAALGQTDAGRYLIVYFIYKTTAEALIVSARDMTKQERRTYGKKETRPDPTAF